MKILLYADPHLSMSSSLVKYVGASGFTARLDNLIESFEWMRTNFDYCDMVFCLGDFTDRSDLNATEITAMSKLGAEDHHFIVGNHCRSNVSGSINTLSMFKNVYYEPTYMDLDGKKVLILPYRSDNYDLSEYDKVDIILSHNDISGVRYGGYVNHTGFNISDILDKCDLFINGHIHSGGYVVKDKIVNLGQLTGVNFSSCGGEWEPSVGVLDTDSMSLEIIQNPFAIKYKKVEFDNVLDCKSYVDGIIGNRYVLQVKVPNKIADGVRSMINSCPFVVGSRIIVIPDELSAYERIKERESEITTVPSMYRQLKEFLKSLSTDDYPDIVRIINEMEGNCESEV